MNPIEGTLRRVDRYQQRHGWLGFPFAVVKKFGDDKGGNRHCCIWPEGAAGG